MDFRKMRFLFGGAALISLVSCGEYGVSDMRFATLNKNMVPEVVETPAEDEQGVYKAVLWTLNKDVPGNQTVGTATLSIRNGQLQAEVRVDGAPSEIVHVQHIHAAEKCPTLSDDANGDGFLDVVEGLPSYGPILLALDGDLTDHDGGSEFFPMADSEGSYHYMESADLTQIMMDLMSEERGDNPVLEMLQGPLNLSGRTIVVHGVPEEVELPLSVESIAGLPAQATLPIACGELTPAMDIGGK